LIFIDFPPGRANLTTLSFDPSLAEAWVRDKSLFLVDNASRFPNRRGLNMRLRHFPILLGLLVSPLSYAQDAIYVGVGVYQFDYEENIPNVVISGISDTSSAYKLFGGFQFNDYLAMEIGFGQSGDLTYNVVRNVPGFGETNYSLMSDFKISSLKAMGLLPMEWGVLLAGLGTFRADNDFREDILTECCGLLSGDGSFTDTGLTASFGVEWRFGRFGTIYGVRLEYEWWDMDDIDTSQVGFAFSYGF
jgi:hypothetical protein